MHLFILSFTVRFTSFNTLLSFLTYILPIISPFLIGKTTSFNLISILKLFNIVLNFFMIPYFSYNGAALTTVLSDVLIVTLQTYVIHKIGKKANKKLYFDLIKIVIGSAVLGIALYFLKLNMWVAIPVGIIIYLTVVTLLRTFDEDDKYVIREIIGKN